MKESLNIEQGLQTVQRLSPRQVQFVRLLEMSAPEIEEEVRRQLDDNPALATLEADDTGVEKGEGTEILEVPINRDPDDDPEDYTASQQKGNAVFPAPQIEQDGPELGDYLMRQLGEIEMPELTRQIATYIIGNIDENGWLTRTLNAMRDDIEINTGIEISYDQIRQAFEIVRSLDPPGIGAVDLRDCMLLQLNRLKPMTLTIREAKDIVANYFDLLSKKHYDRLQSQVGIKDREEMQAALALIRSLNPKPGSSIAPTQSALRISQITPDVSVEMMDDGRYNISLLSNLPQLQIEKSFSPASPSKSSNATVTSMQRDAQAFIKLKRDDAEAFISALQQRSNTLLAVTEAIVRLQPDFFATGETSRLKPMILKDIAGITGLDISVISRATAGKYVSTNTGTYPLKMFFNEAPKDNSDTSSHQIMHVLQQVIDNEDKRHPLSDEAICAEMSKLGYDVARRTVTKYREKLGIPVGRLRKKL